MAFSGDISPCSSTSLSWRELNLGNSNCDIGVEADAVCRRQLYAAEEKKIGDGEKRKLKKVERFNPAIEDRKLRKLRAKKRKLERKERELEDDACTKQREVSSKMEQEVAYTRRREIRSKMLEEAKGRGMSEGEWSCRCRSTMWFSKFALKVTGEVHPVFDTDAEWEQEDFNSTMIEFIRQQKELEDDSCSMEVVDRNAFRKKLENELSKPFAAAELLEMEDRARSESNELELEGTCVDSATPLDGACYLDRFPSFAKVLTSTSVQEDKLNLLRGFFFWIENHCMEGAFQPWKPVEIIQLD